MRVVRTPGVMGGYPCFEGTRICFDTVLNLVDWEDFTPADIPEWYPTLTPDAWDAAIRFYVLEATAEERSYVRIV